MHTPLDSHLHTPECNALIRKLLECHRQNSKFAQALFGRCDDLDRDMRRCTKAERIAKRDAIRVKALEQQVRTKDRMKSYEGLEFSEFLQKARERASSGFED